MRKTAAMVLRLRRKRSSLPPKRAKARPPRAAKRARRLQRSRQPQLLQLIP